MTRDPYTARPYQQEVIDDALRLLSDRDRVQVVMACGTGKTLVAQRIAESLTAGNDAPLILCLYPNLGLLAQNVRNWQLDSLWPRVHSNGTPDKPFHAIAFCSETQAGKTSRRLADDEIALAEADLTVPNTTDPAVLAHWVAEHAGTPRVVFATYQSSDRIPLAHTKFGLPTWDAAVCDEAHRTAGAGLRGEDRKFTTILQQGLIPVAERVFFTATPRVHKSGKDATNGDQTTVTSMDDETVYGPRAKTVSFSRAVELGRLQSFDVTVACINDDDLLQLTKSRGFDVKAETGMEAAELAQVAVSINAATQNGAWRQLVFHSRNITDSKAFTDLLNKLADTLPPELVPAKGIVAQHIDGTTGAEERAESLHRLDAAGDGQAYVLSNVKCLTEGIDVPNLDAVMFAGIKRSTVDIVQAVGRACRKGADQPDGHRALVVLPVYVGVASNPEEEIETAGLKEMVDIMHR
ncbi:MAG: DEAD/DEAH box helicase family protein, partial [Actinomycetota bacterium]|nr:DEAD/DEAH box helicase family protein [Actinomycetota bacterium]